MNYKAIVKSSRRRKGDFELLVYCVLADVCSRQMDATESSDFDDGALHIPITSLFFFRSARRSYTPYLFIRYA